MTVIHQTADTEQHKLWTLVYEQLRPKPKDKSPNGCLNRLTNERLSVSSVIVNESTAVVRQEDWFTSELIKLDAKHNNVLDYDDLRPIVVVVVGERHLLVDDNHRVARWLAQEQRPNFKHTVLLIRLRA